MHSSFRADLGLSFLNKATTYLARAAGSASHLQYRQRKETPNESCDIIFILHAFVHLYTCKHKNSMYGIHVHICTHHILHQICWLNLHTQQQTLLLHMYHWVIHTNIDNPPPSRTIVKVSKVSCKPHTQATFPSPTWPAYEDRSAVTQPHTVYMYM